MDAITKDSARSKVPYSVIKAMKVIFDDMSDDEQQKTIDRYKEVCEDFLESDKGGDKDTYGYGMCCDVFELCGMSGWWIFFIIVIVVGCLAAAGAAFWFFYLRRKLGGRDVEETGEGTNSSAQSGYEISVDTY